MNHFARGCLLLWMLGAVACRQRESEIVADETRALTVKDAAVKLHASSAERFGGQASELLASPLTGQAPAHWVALPAAQFRLLNHRFGASGKGEVYVTIASGGVVENVNRWLGQFGAPALDAAGVAALRKVPVLGREGVWVEAKGTYRGAMGRADEPGFGLAGVVVEAGGRLVTVKMTGPEAEVAAEQAALEEFAKSLRFAAGGEGGK
jgi:hypothetical protein